MSHHTPVSNNEYNLLTVLQSKLEASHAYDKYIQDAQDDNELSQLFQRIKEQDDEHVHELRHHLSRMLGQGGGG